MAEVQITCPHCGEALRASLGPTADIIKCPLCHGAVDVTSSDREEFWADKVKRLKQQGLSEEVIRESRKNIPYPGAFREIAIAIRKDIRVRRKENVDAKDLLQKLYKWAVVENLFAEIQWGKIVTERILHSVARSSVKGLKAPYRTIGYENLDLLNKTDVKWLVEALGEPESHLTAREVNAELWEQAVEKFRLAEDKDEQHFWQSHGFDGPPDEIRITTARTRAHSASQSTGCLTTLLLLVPVLISLSVLLDAVTKAEEMTCHNNGAHSISESHASVSSRNE